MEISLTRAELIIIRKNNDFAFYVFYPKKGNMFICTKTTNSLCYVDSERLRDNVHVNPADETSSLMTDTDNNNIELSSPLCPGPGQV